MLTGMLEKTLKRFDPFQTMGPAELTEAARYSRILTVPAERWLLRPGRRLGGRYYLVRGTVRLFSPARDIQAQSPEVRSPLYPGCEAMHTLGEARLLHVDTAPIAFLLDTAQANPAVGEGEDWQRRFMNSPLLKRLDAGIWQQLLSALDERDFQAGERLVVEGTAAHDFFVLKTGHAAVRRRGQTVAHLGPGDFFGEDALLMNARRNATVVATKPGAVLRLPKDRFTALLADNLVRFVKGGAEGVPIDLDKEGTLARLRETIPSLDPGHRYHVVGGGLRERALATFILTQKGFDAWPVD